MERPRLPYGVSASDFGTAAGRDVNIINQHAQRGFHADPETFKELILHGQQLQDQLDDSWQRLREYEEYCQRLEQVIDDERRNGQACLGRMAELEAMVRHERLLPLSIATVITELSAPSSPER